MDILDRLFKKKIQDFPPEPNDGKSMVNHTSLRMSNNDRIRQLIRAELFRREVNNQAETFEEADDFDLDENEPWVSPYEDGFDPPTETPVEPPKVLDKSAADDLKNALKPGGANEPTQNGSLP